jgi:hypothetical protein
MRIGLCAVLLWLASFAALAPAIAADAPGDYVVSYAAGARDAAGRFVGGTELRSLVTHGGKLYAGIGSWEDRPGP